MLRTLMLIFIVFLFTGCGPSTTSSLFEERLLDEIDYEGAITFRNDWRLRAYETEEQLNILIVTGIPDKEINYNKMKNSITRTDPRVQDFRWEGSWHGQVTLKNMTPDLFDDVCDWIEDEGDWDDITSKIRWEDTWIQGIIKNEAPYLRYKDIHEVWVVESILEMEAFERESPQLAQLCCILGLPISAISFWPEHHESAKGTLHVKIYDPLNRKYRADKSITVKNTRKRVHSYLGDILGHLTLGMCNFPPRTTCLWYPLYDTDSTSLLSDLLDDMDDGDFAEGVEDLVVRSELMRPDTEPASLRVKAQNGYIDSSRVVTVPFSVKNRGKGEAWNVRVLVEVKNQLLTDVVPRKIELGDIGPGQNSNSKVTFKLPSVVKNHEIVLTLQPKDESPQSYRKTRVRIPVNR